MCVSHSTYFYQYYRFCRCFLFLPAVSVLLAAPCYERPSVLAKKRVYYIFHENPGMYTIPSDATRLVAFRGVVG